MGASVRDCFSKLGDEVKLTGKLEAFLRQGHGVDAMQTAFTNGLKGERLAKLLNNDWIPPFRSQGERFQIRLGQLPDLGV